MQQKQIEKIHSKMICLQCQRQINFIALKKNTGVFVCRRCPNFYLFEDGIITALPRQFIDKELYRRFAEKNARQLGRKLHKELVGFISKLPKRKITWEDDDVVFWNKRYVGDCLELRTKKLVERAYLRDKVLFSPMRANGIKNHFILEIGCGEAISAQKSLLPYGDDFIYFATDYARQGLVTLRRRLKNRKNVIYLQCLGDALPFKDGTFDEIISLGVIHHMPKKEAHVPYLFKKIKKGGLLILNEGYERDYRLPKFLEKVIQLVIEPNQSAHEERINIRKFKKNLQKEGVVLSEFHTHTPVKTLLIRLTGSLYERSVGFVRFVIYMDKISEKTFGKISKLFRPGDCLILVQKK